MSKKFLYAHVSQTNGCYHHRLLLPFRNIAATFPGLDFDLSLTDPYGDYNYYLTHGNPPLRDFTYFGKWKREGGQWILSLDDDYFSLPEWSSAKLSEEQLDLFYACFDLADHILVSTPGLAAAVNRPNKTVIAPNLMPVEDYEVVSPAPTRSNEKLRIVWSGSTTHAGDFDVATAAIDKILKKYSNIVEFIFMGYCPSRLLRDWHGRGVHYETGAPLAVYPKVLNRMRPHIVLAPLADIKFNLSKSNIRVLEGWSLAAAVIASPVGEYKVVRHGVDGLVAATTDEWYNGLEELINKQQLREQLAIAGRNRVASEWDWSNPDCHKPWLQFVEYLKTKVRE